MPRYVRNVQDLLTDGKTPYERRFGDCFGGPVIPFGAMVEKLSDSRTRPVKARPIGHESFTWNIPRLCTQRGASLERRHFGRRH